MHSYRIKFMKNEILINFGNNVKLYRSKKKLSQESLANLCGLHRTYIGMVERAEKNLTLLNIKKIAIALEIDISDLTKGL